MTSTDHDQPKAGTRAERRAAAVDTAAARRSRERRLSKVQPGWWVFSYGPTDLGSWGRVDAVTTFLDPRGRAMVRLALTDTNGAGREIENVPASAAWSLTATDARRVGLG